MDELFDKIKDGANKAKDNAERLAKEVAKRTQNAFNYTKLSISSNELQNKIKEVYVEIGKTVYEKYLNGEEQSEDITSSLEQLDKLMDESAFLQEKIAELKNSLKCAQCGAFNPANADFCIKCGSPLDKEDNDDNENNNEEYEINDIIADAADDTSDNIIDIDDDDDEVIIITPKKTE